MIIMFVIGRITVVMKITSIIAIMITIRDNDDNIMILIRRNKIKCVGEGESEKKCRKRENITVKKIKP